MFKRWKSSSVALTVVLTATLMTVTSPTASAFSTSGPRIVWSHSLSTYCVKAVASFDHHEPGTLSMDVARAEAYAQGWSTLAGGCTLPRTGWARVRLVVEVWDGNSTWLHCNGTSWVYGPVGWDSSDLPGPTGPEAQLDYSGWDLCGRQKYYRTVAYGEYGGATGESWVGGSVASPYEYLP